MKIKVKIKAYVFLFMHDVLFTMFIIDFTPVNMAFNRRGGGNVCGVKNCFSRQHKDPNISFHVFPRNEERYV